VAILFTRTLADQRVRAEVRDRFGFSLELGPGDLVTEGELLVVPLEEIPNATEVTVRFEPASLTTRQKEMYSWVDEERPAWQVVDAWVTPVPDPAAEAEARQEQE
jgi:hypothetical protein